MEQPKPRNYHIKTYGCQMNERDSETIAGVLAKRGMSPSALTAADVIFVNTCTVRDKAEQKVFGFLGRLRELKEANPDLVLGICGCMTQQQAVAAKIKARFPYMDIIIGTHNLEQLDSYLDRVLQKRQRVLELWKQRSEAEIQLPARRVGKYKAFVNINYGCNNFCSYCIVPYVRGREKSRTVQAIREEIQALIDEGYLEITLLGQNVNSYGRDLPRKPDFALLLKHVHAVQGLERIRFMTSHPRDVNERLIEALASLPKVCKHIHLPLQAGSNRILELMNRGYTREHFISLTEQLRRDVPEISLTTDIIVGFPGETEADFAQTLAAVEKIRFDSAFTFMFSPRSGTPAAKMEGQLPLAEKRSRLQRLMETQNRISLELNQQLIGTKQHVLVEEKAGKLFKGRTSGNKLVFVHSDGEITGKTVHVDITEAGTWNLAGRTEG